jgi:hypothetical protein
MTKLVSFEMMREAMETAIEKLETEEESSSIDLAISLPAVWGDSDGWDGPPPDDPLMIYILASVDHGDYTVEGKISLSEELHDRLEACAEDTSFSEGLRRIATGLRDLADKIDEAITAGERAWGPHGNQMP